MTTSALQKLQAEFRQYLLGSGTNMEKHITGSGRTDAATRLAIYSDGYRIRLVQALDANYPILHKWLGDEEFDRLGRAYLDAYPSQHYSIRWFGHHLSAFLADTLPWREQFLVRELVDFEWAMSKAFDATDDAVVALEHIATIPPQAWPGMRLRFHSSLHRLWLEWNIPPIWRTLGRDETPAAPEQSEAPIAWIVWRQELALYYRSLEIDEAWALDAAGQGQNFAALCEGLCAWTDPEHVAGRAAGFLQQWIRDGLITHIEPEAV